MTRLLPHLGWMIFLGAVLCGAEEPQLPLYVGRDICLGCHGTGGGARSCTLEPIPAHGLAHDRLSTPEALEIAAISGCPQPHRESRICLGCHATSADEGRRWTLAGFSIADGVQCEACHGAGSLHVAAALSAKGGAADGRSSRGIARGDRGVCVECHGKQPSHEAVLRRGYRMPAADRLYRTPVNLAVSPDGRFLHVVCEHSNSLIIIDLEEERILVEIPVGMRPNDVAITPDGSTVYVTNRFSDTVSIIDAASRTVTGEIPVGDDPHGVVVAGDGGRLYVLNTGEDSISVIDARLRREQKRLAAARGPWSATLRNDGASLCVTNVWPLAQAFREPPRSEITVVSTAEGIVTDRPPVPDANMLEGIAAVPGSDVVIFTLMRTKNLVPITRLAQGWTITNGLGILWPDGRVDQVLLDEPERYFPDPTDVAVSPDGRHAAVTGGGSDEVAIVDVARLLETITSASEREREEMLPNHLGQSARFLIARVPVGANPRGIAFSPDGRRIYVANALADSISVIDAADFTPVGEIPLGGPTQTTQIRLGETLFHSAAITYGKQFSCRGCHPDGHVNGLTFDIEPDGLGVSPVDNRTLRGILDTAPFKWEGTNPSLRRQCGPRLAVFFTRLDPFTPEQLDALVRYMSTIERPPNRHRSPEGLTLQQRRGKAVFERSTNNYGAPIPTESRCRTCHNNPYRTSRRKALVGTTMWFDAPARPQVRELGDTASFGPLGMVYFQDISDLSKAFDVPHLTNIHDSPPYLHNGSAATLEEIWTLYNLYEGHGTTHDLTRRQLNDLVAYLKTL